MDGSVSRGVTFPFRRSSNPDYRNECYSACELCGVSFGVLLTCPVIFSMQFAVSGGPVALVSLRCCKWLSSDDFFAILTIIITSVVYLSVLALFLEREALSRISRSMILTSCVEPLSLLFRELFFAVCSSNTSCPEPLNWMTSSPLDWNVTRSSAKDASSALQPSSSTSSFSLALYRKDARCWCWKR